MNKFPSCESFPPTTALALTMRKLIRSTTTSAFLKRDGAWTLDIAIAAAFGDYVGILDTISQFDLRDVELYYSFHRFRKSQWDFVTPL